MQTAEQIIQAKNKKIVTIDHQATVLDAINKMNNAGIGAIFIERDGVLVGVWTERDLLRNVATPGFDPATAKIADYMITDLISVPSHYNAYQLLDVFLGRRIRHLLIKKEDEYIGVISPGDIMKAYITEKDAELKNLNAFVSWEYYENWRWDKKR